MKRKYLTFPLIGLLALATSCGGGGSKKDQDKKGDKDKEKKMEKVTTYSYDHNSTIISWTAYKHTAKNPVKGKFDSTVVKGINNGAKSVSKLLGNASFQVFTSSVNSNDPTRDKKIRESFFETMTKTSKITGSVKDLDIDGDKGKGTLNFKMNDMKKELPVELSLDGKNLKLVATMDVKNWKASEALAALQKACEDKHTGEDGKTKLWSEVKVIVKTTLKTAKKKMAMK